MTWVVRYTEPAKQDLQDIRDYFEDVLMEPFAADRQIDGIMKVA